MVEHVRDYLGHEVRRRGEDYEWTRTALDPDALTIVFARRFATYKRATLLLSQPERLERLLRDRGRPVQFIFAGKAHPKDVPGQALLREIVQFGRRPEFRDRFMFLEGYDVQLARHLVQGADIWLNVPLRPYEASGTSGMKAAANGGLNLSIPDGWWAEAWDEHNRLPEPIGWSIAAGEQVDDLDGPEAGRADRDLADADCLFDLLEGEIVPLFYGDPDGWAARCGPPSGSAAGSSTRTGWSGSTWRWRTCRRPRATVGSRRRRRRPAPEPARRTRRRRHGCGRGPRSPRPHSTFPAARASIMRYAGPARGRCPELPPWSVHSCR
jgi:hypothetical protein